MASSKVFEVQARRTLRRNPARRSWPEEILGSARPYGCHTNTFEVSTTTTTADNLSLRSMFGMCQKSASNSFGLQVVKRSGRTMDQSWNRTVQLQLKEGPWRAYIFCFAMHVAAGLVRHVTWKSGLVKFRKILVGGKHENHCTSQCPLPDLAM